MTRTVVFSLRAERQMREMFRYLSHEASSGVAQRQLSKISRFCYFLAQFPHRGILLGDLAPDLHVITYSRTITLAYIVAQDAVVIIGIYTNGQNYLAELAEGVDPAPE